MSRAALAGTDDVLRLRPQLQSRLDAHFGKRRAIVGIEHRPVQYRSSFRIDELDVRLTDGATVRMVLKNLSRDQMFAAARRRPTFLYRPQRELAAYRWLLPGAPAGTAVLMGSMANARRERFWLMLERVNGRPLWQEGGVAVWKLAASWIAKFHQSFTADEARRIAKRIGAIECTEEWYWRWLDRAQRFAAHDTRRRRVLARVHRSYGRVVEHLRRLPQTMIHGEFYASNVMIRRRARSRVCPVDWEMTAVGPGLIDLAALTAGWVERTQQVLAVAYRSAGGFDSSRDFDIGLDCSRLYLAVRMLGWSSHWEPPRDHSNDWTAVAEVMCRRLETRV